MAHRWHRGTQCRRAMLYRWRKRMVADSVRAMAQVEVAVLAMVVQAVQADLEAKGRDQREVRA